MHCENQQKAKLEGKRATRTHSSIQLQAQLLPTTQGLVLCPQEVAETESIGLRETHVGSELYHFLLEGLTKISRISISGSLGYVTNEVHLNTD